VSEELAREARLAARALLGRVLLGGFAVALGAAGLAFLIYAGFAALRVQLGPGLSALVLGVGLLVLAAVLMLASGRAVPVRQPTPDSTPGAAPGTPSPRADAAELAAFTASFVIGRFLAGKMRR
jgi:hypothetical protein